MSKIIGIDLGTTNTCAAYVSNKIPRIIPIEGGFNLMPSMVTFHPSGSVLIGQAAREQLVAHPDRTLHGIKRLLGRQFHTQAVRDLQARVGYEIVSGNGGEAEIRVGDKTHTPVAIQTRLLEHVKRYAEINLGEDIPEAVIAVPAYYTDHQRVLVKEAATAAGFDVRRLVNEPTAAALAYGFNRGFDQKILIYDLGGGTFDVSVLELTGNVFDVIATGGDTYLGGADFDERVIDWVVESFKRQTKIDLREDNAAMQRVRTAAERAKIELSLLMNTQLRLPSIVERRGRAVDLELVLDRDTLNQLTEGLLKRTIDVVEVVLSARGIERRDIDELILVGGQTRMPLVGELISSCFGKAPRKGVNPDECVAIGAALLADSLVKIDAVTLLDALSIPIGIANSDGMMQLVIDKHTKLPGRASVAVSTTHDQQEVVQVEVFQGEAGPVDKAEYLGTLVYKNVPPLPAGEVSVTFDFALDAEGLLTVEATHDHGGAPEVLHLATLERPLAAQAHETSTVSPEPATGEPADPGIRGFVRTLWGAKR